MTNKNKKRRAPSGYRAPRPASAARSTSAPQRQGIFGSLLGPRVPVDTDMPRVRTSIGRGFITTVGTPAIVLGAVGAVFVAWSLAVLAGFQGPFAIFVDLLAIPPLGTAFDFVLAQGMFGVQGGLIAVLGFVVVRGVIVALFTGAIVDVLQTGASSRWSLVRGARAIPVAIAANVAAMGLTMIASIAGALLGPGLGLLIQVGSLVAGIYLFGFATPIAAAEGRRIPDSLARSIRAGRMPGAGNLGFAALYVIPAFALLVVPGKPGSGIGVNPTIGAWVFVLAINLIQVSMLAALTFRYLSVADDVPEPAARATARARTR